MLDIMLDCDMEQAIWDRLGRAGRAKQPKSQHWNPEIKRKFHEHGVGLAHLPPKGCEMDPIEKANNAVQQKVRWWRRKGAEQRDVQGRIMYGPQNLEEVQLAVNEAVRELNAKPQALLQMYEDRATGNDWLKRMKNTEIFKEVQAKRRRDPNKYTWDFERYVHSATFHGPDRDSDLLDPLDASDDPEDAPADPPTDPLALLAAAGEQLDGAAGPSAPPEALSAHRGTKRRRSQPAPTAWAQHFGTELEDPEDPEFPDSDDSDVEDWMDQEMSN